MGQVITLVPSSERLKSARNVSGHFPLSAVVTRFVFFSRASMGEMLKTFNIKDGCGIHDILIPSGIIPVIMTGRKSDIVLNRCKELGITEIFQGIKDKATKLKGITSDLSRVAYIGDDINDLPCMLEVQEAGGLIGCPKDAAKNVIEVSDFIAEHNGGEGAVRDFIEWIAVKNKVVLREMAV